MSRRRLVPLCCLILAVLASTLLGPLPAGWATSLDSTTVLASSSTDPLDRSGMDQGSVSVYQGSGTTSSSGRNSRSISFTGSQVEVDLYGVDSWAVGDLTAAARVGISVQLAASGRFSIQSLTRAADGTLTSLAASWDISFGDATRHVGFVRWKSDVPWTGLQVTATSGMTAEVGTSRTDRVATVTNTGPSAASALPALVSSDGSSSSDWSLAGSTTCSSTSTLAPGDSCTLDLTFAPAHTMDDDVILSFSDLGSPMVLFLRGNGVGVPGAPAVTTAGTPFGVAVAWTLSPDTGGANPQTLTISRSVNGGAWTDVSSIDRPSSMDSSTLLWPAGATSMRVRARLTNAPAIQGQTTVYTSDWSLVPAPATPSGRGYLLGQATYGRVQGAAARDLSTGLVAVYPGSRQAVPVPDGSAVLTYAPTGTSRGLARITVASGSESPTVLYPSAGDPIAVSPDGATVAWTTGTSMCWASATVTGPVTCRDGLSTNSAAFLPDGRTLAVAVMNPPELMFVDLDGGSDIHTGIAVTSVVISPDGRLVVLQPSTDSGMYPPHQARALDARTLRLGPPHDLDAPFGSVAFVDARTVVTSGSRLLTLADDGSPLAGSTPPVGPNSSTFTTYGDGPAVMASGTSDRPTFTISSGTMPTGSTTRCAVDAGPAFACNGAWTAPVQTPGRHVLTVTGTTPDGRGATTARGWSVGRGRFVSLSARRVLDTRTGIGAPRSRLSGGQTIVLTIPGLPADVTAVSLNLTAVGASVPTYLTTYPPDAPRPGTSTLNVQGQAPVANQATVRVAGGGRVAVYDAAGSVDVVADLQGYFRSSTGDRFTAIPPIRAVDSRTGRGGITGPVADVGITPPLGSQLGPSFPYDLSSATAFAFNLTAAAPTRAGYLALADDAQGRPGTSNLNFGTGQAVANLAVVSASRGENTSLAFWHGGGGTVQTIADLIGWYGRGGSALTAVTPTRVLDTRTGTGAPAARLGPGQSVTVTLRGLPAGTTAVAVNLTAVSPSAGGYVTAYPAGSARPATSSINFAAATTVAGATVVAVDDQGRFVLSNATGSVDLVADLQGYYAP